MKQIGDFKTDEGDDIIFHDDIFIEQDDILSVVKTCERRLSARYDDFVFESIGAGLERYLGDFLDGTTEYFIEDDIRRCLSTHGLLNNLEYNIQIIEQDTRELKILIKFILADISKDYNFSVKINQENQRSYS